MSYEGYEQNICANGHLYNSNDVYHMGDSHAACPHCDAACVFSNSVDDTNCNSFGIILDWSSFLVTEAVFEKCSIGHRHLVTEAVYRIPTKEEAKALQHFRANGKYIPVSKAQEYYDGQTDPDWGDPPDENG